MSTREFLVEMEIEYANGASREVRLGELRKRVLGLIEYWTGEAYEADWEMDDEYFSQAKKNVEHYKKVYKRIGGTK